ncbi:MAG: cell division ATP-binding protein FtsE [Candidatus Kapaibacterium sp.]
MDFVFDDISVRFDGIPAVDSVSFHLREGGGVLLTGASGAGKTTLLRLLYGACMPSSGTLLINGAPSTALRGAKLRRHRAKMGVVFQDARLIPAFTVYENVMLPLIIQGHTKRAADSRCLDVMSDLGISYLREKHPAHLSGGERELAALARALVAYPECIVADEPTAQLNSGSVERIVQVLMREHARGATLVVATHDELVMQRFSGMGRLHLNEGRIEQAVTLAGDRFDGTERVLADAPQSAAQPESPSTEAA